MKLTHFFVTLFLFIIWGLNFVVIKIGLKEIPPVFLVFIRFFLTSFPAIFFIKRPNISLSKLLIYGLVMFALQFGFLFSAMEHGITPALASILLQLQVFFTIALGSIVFKEKLSTSQIFGALVAFSGMAIIAKNLSHEVTLSGVLLVIAAAACSAPGNAICKKMGDVDMVAVVVWSSLFAWPALLLFSVYLEGCDKILLSLMTLNKSSFGAVAYITYLSTFLGYYIWNYLISKYPMSVVAPYSLLSPIFGTFFSCILLGETLPTWKISCGLLVLAGLCINLAGSYLEKRSMIYKKSKAENLVD